MPDHVVIENDLLKAAISPTGAELRSLYLKQARCPLVWEGDPEIWQSSAPWLFPIVGRLKDGSYEYRGRKYRLEKHGFARKSLFDVKMPHGREAVFTLCDTPGTLRVYPWPFRLKITYRLDGCALTAEAEILNTGCEAMPFSIGAHPGFYAAAGDRLLFEREEDLPVYRLDRAVQLLDPMAKERFTGRELLLTPGLFDDDAMILARPASRRVTLVRPHAPDVCVTFPAVPYLGLWCKTGPNLPYICIEPWYGVDDAVDATGEILAKKAINMLAPGQAFSMTLKLEAIEK